jgi:hypothetical protein
MFLSGINPLDHNTKQGGRKINLFKETIYSFTCLERKLGHHEQHFGKYCKHLKVPKKYCERVGCLDGNHTMEEFKTRIP